MYVICTWPVLSLCEFIILGHFSPHSSSFSGGERSPILQEVSVTIFNNSDCRRAYSSPLVPRRNYPEGIVNSQLCAGDPRGGKDACQVWEYCCISAEINASSIKCNISLVHAMKPCRSNRGITQLILNLSIRWRWVFNTTPQLLYLGKESLYTLHRRLGGPQSCSGRSGGEKIIFLLPLSFLQYAVHSGYIIHTFWVTVS